MVKLKVFKELSQHGTREEFNKKFPPLPLHGKPFD
jgi:hypothetical protein